MVIFMMSFSVVINLVVFGLMSPLMMHFMMNGNLMVRLANDCLVMNWCIVVDGLMVYWLVKNSLVMGGFVVNGFVMGLNMMGCFMMSNCLMMVL